MKRRPHYSAFYFMVDHFQDILDLDHFMYNPDSYTWTNESWAEDVKKLVGEYRNLFNLGGYTDLKLWLHICRKFDRAFDEVMDTRFKEDREGIQGWTKTGNPIYQQQ